MISFSVSDDSIEQKICQSLINSRGDHLNIKVNCIPLTGIVDTCSFTLHHKIGIYLDFNIIFQNSLMLRNDGSR